VLLLIWPMIIDVEAAGVNVSEKSKSIKLTIDQFDPSTPSENKGKQTGHTFLEQDFELLDYIKDVIFVVDKAGQFKFINKISEERSGIPSDAMIGLNYLDIIQPDNHEFARGSFESAMKGEAAPAIEMEWQAASGETITVEVNWTTLYEDNAAVGLLGVMRDVTDRKNAQDALAKACDELEMRVRERTADLQKANNLLREQIAERVRAEEKLRESEEKYRELFENSADAVIIVDTETGIILDANQQAAQVTGRLIQDLIGMHQSRLHPDDQEGYYTEKIKEHINNDRAFDLEADVMNKDGSIVPVFISSSLITLQGKNVVQEIFRDISKEKLISDLKGELATKKLVNRAKAIIAKRYSINDGEAMRLLQKESRRQSRKIKEVAQAVISSKFILY